MAQRSSNGSELCVLPGTSVKILGKGAHTREAWSWGVGGALS